MSNKTLNDLGEFGLINSIKEKTTIYNKSSLKGIGDDAAIIDCGSEVMAISSDSMNEAIHFDLRYVPLKHLGYKAVSTAISDIAAMNLIPTQVLINLSLSSKFTLEAIEEIYLGINAAAESYKVDVIGGDTSASAAGLSISVTAIGKGKKENVVYRSGAGEGDIVCVTGDLGAAYLGLQALEREKQVFLDNPEMQPKLEDFEYMVQRQLKPEARTEIIHDLAEAKIKPTSMIDISDGLASEILHICNESNLGCFLYEDKIPVNSKTYDTAVETFKIDPITCMLNGGEDYELLFTIKQDDYEKIKNHPDISVIGYMKKKEDGCNLITKGENIIPITAQGWDHMKNK